MSIIWDGIKYSVYTAVSGAIFLAASKSGGGANAVKALVQNPSMIGTVAREDARALTYSLTRGGRRLGDDINAENHQARVAASQRAQGGRNQVGEA